MMAGTAPLEEPILFQGWWKIPETFPETGFSKGGDEGAAESHRREDLERRSYRSYPL